MKGERRRRRERSLELELRRRSAIERMLQDSATSAETETAGAPSSSATTTTATATVLPTTPSGPQPAKEQKKVSRKRHRYSEPTAPPTRVVPRVPPPPATAAPFRPRTAAPTGPRRPDKEDLEAAVERILSSDATPTTASTPHLPSPPSAMQSPRFGLLETPPPAPPPTPPSRPLVISEPAAQPEITVHSPSRSPSQTMDAEGSTGLTPREQMEIALDIDTNPERHDDDASSKTHIPSPMLTKTASIEVHSASDDTAPSSPTQDSSFLQVPSELTSRRSSTETARSEMESRLSFIVREKLHHFASDIRRRTSQVMEEVIQEDYDDEEEEDDASLPGGGFDQGASLMSLIGLADDDEEQTQAATTSTWRLIPTEIDPSSRWYLPWLTVLVLAFLYNAFSIPLRCSYPYQTEDNLVFWLMADYFCDFIYIIDMVLVKPRQIYMSGGITIRDKQLMRREYLISLTFKCDVLCLLPSDIFYFLTGPIAAWRTNRLGKITAFWEFFDLLDSSFSNPYFIRIARTFCYMIYLIHCNSCVYYVLSAWQAFGQLAYKHKGQWYLNKWVYNNQGNAYIRCFYFTAAVATSTGNNPAPSNVIEYAYMTFSWMMGVFVFALLLGQIRDIVYNANKNAEEFRTIMDKALSECKRLDLPPQTIEKVRTWFMYTWEQQKTLDESKLVNRLPKKLQTDLALSVHYNTLSKVQLFQDCDRAFLRDLVLKLKPVIFQPNDMICRKGDVGKEMYIVNHGILQVVGGGLDGEPEKVFAELKEGSVFGEISLLAIGGNNRRTANIRSKGYSTLFVLSKEDLNDVIKDYPEAQQRMKKKARQMLKKDQKKVTRSRKDLRDELAKKCEVSTAIPTPKMLQTVTQLLPAKSEVKRELQSKLRQDSLPRRQSLKRWSTIPDDFSDTSDSEFPRTLLLAAKSRSLDLTANPPE